jgi:O-antigen ligase
MHAVLQQTWRQTLSGLFGRPAGWTDWRAGARNTMNGALLAFLALLPSVESGKLAALVVYMIAGTAWLALERRLRAPDLLETAVIALLAASAVSSALAAVWDTTGDALGKFRGLHYVVGACLLFLIPYRSGYTVRERLLLLVVLLAATVPEALRGEWRFLTGQLQEVTLSAIGGSNNSGAHVAVLLGILVGWLLVAWRHASALARLLLVALLASGVALLIDMESRGAVFGFFVFLLVLLALDGSRRLWLIAGTITAAALGWTVLMEPVLLTKFKMVSLDGIQGIIGLRWDYWRVAVAAGMENPLFGIGPGNFVRQDVLAYGIDLTPGNDQVLRPGHAHSLFLGRLAEGGFVGLLTFLAVLALALWQFIRRRREMAGARLVVWYAGLSSWIVFVASGLFLDTFARENGQLMFLLLGLALAPYPPAQAAAPAHHQGSHRHGAF